MQFHSDIRGVISSFLTLEDIPSLRACSGMNALKSSVITQQAAIFGWNKEKGEPYAFVKKLFETIRLAEYYSFSQKDYIYRDGQKIYVLKVYKTLIHLKNISFNNAIKVFDELDPDKHPWHYTILHVIGLSALKMIAPLSQETKDRALMKAARFSCAPICLKILEQGGDPNYILQKTCFHEVVLRGQVALAETFLSFNADPSITSIDFESTLQIAVESGSIQMLELILSTGVQDTPTPSGTAFSKALNIGRIAMAKILKEQAQRLCRDSSFNSYLHLAMMKPDQKWMLEQFDPTPQINTLNNPLMTPLHVAVNNRNEEGIRYLLANGANPNIRGILGKTPLELAPDNLRPLFGRYAKRRRRTHAAR